MALPQLPHLIMMWTVISNCSHDLDLRQANWTWRKGEYAGYLVCSVTTPWTPVLYLYLWNPHFKTTCIQLYVLYMPEPVRPPEILTYIFETPTRFQLHIWWKLCCVHPHDSPTWLSWAWTRDISRDRACWARTKIKRSTDSREAHETSKRFSPGPSCQNLVEGLAWSRDSAGNFTWCLIRDQGKSSYSGHKRANRELNPRSPYWVSTRANRD
jgi:hypothetical protein